jgi:hypothetical protein
MNAVGTPTQPEFLPRQEGEAVNEGLYTAHAVFRGVTIEGGACAEGSVRRRKL